MTPEEYLRERLEYHLPEEQGKGELIALLLPLLAMGVRQSAAVWQGLRKEVAQAVVLALKEDAERHWGISLDGSLERANQIVVLGEARSDLGVQALGTMAKADAIKLDKARWREAWILLDHAAYFYQYSSLDDADKEIGWARTRIGRVFMAPELEETEIAFADAEKAQKILETHQVWIRLVNLHLCWARALDILLRPKDSLPHYERAIRIATEMGEEGKSFLPRLYHNMGIALDGFGETEKAVASLNHSLALIHAAGDTYSPSFLAITELTIGAMLRYLGAYGRALRFAYRAEETLAATHPSHWLASVRLLMRCHLDLQRYAEARQYGQKMLEVGFHHKRDVAFTHRYLAQAEIGLGNLQAAHTHFEVARSLFLESGFDEWVAIVRVEEGMLALNQANFHQALAIAQEVLEKRQGHAIANYDIEALLVMGEAYLGLGNFVDAKGVAQRAWKLARQHKRMPQHYRSHLLLGKISEALHADLTAQRRYKAAVATTARIHRNSGHTLHADVSGSYQVGFHRLMQVQLKQNKFAEAFTTLELQKSRLFLSYIQERGRFRWTQTPETQPLIDELAKLRAERQRLHRTSEKEFNSLNSDSFGLLEQRIRRITETLYLHSGAGMHGLLMVPNLQELQQNLPKGSVLLEYYDNGETIWCFVVESHSVRAYPLAISSGDLADLVEKVYENQQMTLRTGLPDEAWTAIQSKKARQDYAKLGSALLAPLVNDIPTWQRLYIVPYGVLHRLPFNLLRINQKYLIEHLEIVTLPTAALLLQKNKEQTQIERRWVGYSRHGILPHAVAEAQSLHTKWGGNVFVEQQATANVLNGSGCQVLHLSTHGVHRVDHHFDLSYLELADADVYEDDLLQMDLNHELVTLSACEIGSVKVAPGEELIGLGRAFLYAGVEAVVASLWQVREEVTAKLMESFYTQLLQGESKSYALRQAQLDFLAHSPQTHPVYWGAFQLIGRESPLGMEEAV